MNSRGKILFSMLILLLAVAGQAAADEVILIKNGTIVPVVGPTIPSGSLLIKNGRIAQIGQNIKAPDSAKVIDAQGNYIYPGLVAVMTAIGVTGYPGMGNDTDEVGTSTPYVDPYDALNPEDDCIEVTRIGGVLTAHTVSGTQGVINGKSVVLNLAGDLAEDMVIKKNVGQIFNIGAKSRGKYPSTTSGVVALIRDKLNQAVLYSKKQAKEEKSTPKKRDLGMEALVEVVSGKVPAIFITYDEVTIRNALNVIKEYKLKGIIQARTGILKYADRLAREKIPVIWAGTTMLPRRWEAADLYYNTAAVLARKGVLFAFDAGGWGPGNRNVRNLPLPAGISVAYGLSAEEALRAITINPARILGIEDLVGSLEVGKMANVAIWSGDPLQMNSRILQVLIAGQNIPMTSIQTRLRDKYQKIVTERSRKKK